MKGEPPTGLLVYPNVPTTIGFLLSAGRTFTELKSISLEEAYLLQEVIMIDRYNERLINDA